MSTAAPVRPATRNVGAARPAAPAEPATAARAGWPASRLLGRRTLRRVLGVLWLLDALVQAEPSNFGRGYPRTELLQSIMGAPGWERRVVLDLVSPFRSHWPWWNLAIVMLQGAIGLALVADRWIRPALVAAWGWCAVVWLAGEGLGMLPTGFALLPFGAPGPAVLYAALGALAWPSGGRADVDRRWWTAIWVTYWAGGAVLQLPWVYPPGQVLRANVEEASLGQPGWLQAVTRPAAHLALSRPAWTLIGLWAVEVALAAAAVARARDRRAPLAAAIVVSSVVWVVGQQLGGALAPGASDVGTAPLVVLLALAGWPLTCRFRRLPGRQVRRVGGGAAWPAPANLCAQASAPLAPSAATASASFTTWPVNDAGVCIANKMAAST